MEAHLLADLVEAHALPVIKAAQDGRRPGHGLDGSAVDLFHTLTTDLRNYRVSFYHIF